MNSSFEYITSLEYRLKAARTEILAFQSGEKYAAMQKEYLKELRRLERMVRSLKEELAEARSTIVTIRNQWFEVFEEQQKEFDRKLAAAQKRNRELEKRALAAENTADELRDKVTQQRHEIYELKTELEEEKGKNLKLHAQLNRDFENSSIPSSKSKKHKKISNSREKSGKKPGGQPGHKGCCRKKQVPTVPPVLLPPPPEAVNDPDFKKTSKTIVKQHVAIHMMLSVTEYHADVYYNSKTGERIHAAFPEGIVDDVNYDGSIKAFLFLLNNDCCVSIDKSRKFLSDLTDGKLNISKGMINKLSREFSKKSETERRELFAEMLVSPVMHIDCTNAKVNGKNAYVFVCASPDGKAIYSAREKKGHEGVRQTAAQDYQGILVHDHEKTFYNYGSDHQECLAHVMRYLKDSMENEPERTWNRQMRSLLQEMLHYRNSLPEDAECEDAKIQEYEARYKEILEKACEEYEYIPANEYYKDGYNLYLRMEKYMSNHLLFLHDHRVPATNNEAERLLRNYKRKQMQAVSFRSNESLDCLCDCMSVLVMMRQKEDENLFRNVSQIFG